MVQQGSTKPIKKVEVDDQEFSLNVKGAGYNITKPADFFSDIYKDSAKRLIKQKGLARVICQERDDFGRPWGGQSKEYAEQELRLSGLKDLSVLFPPVFSINSVDYRLLIPSPGPYSGSDNVMQELRGVPSNVRLKKFPADAGTVEFSEILNGGIKLENEPVFLKNLFSSMFMLTSLPARSKPGSIYYLPYGSISRDSAVTREGKMYFMDIEEIECERVAEDDIMKHVYRQLRGALPAAYGALNGKCGLDEKALIKIIKEEADLVDDAVNKEFGGRFYAAAKRIAYSS